MKDKICYIWDESLIYQCDRLPAVVGRVGIYNKTYCLRMFIAFSKTSSSFYRFLTFQATMVNDLIVSYSLNKQMKVVRSSPATYEDLRKFHSEFYIDYLKSVIEIDDDYMANTQDEEYGIGTFCEINLIVNIILQ